MTIANHLSTVAASISGLNIPGIKIMDINKIPQAASGLCPLVIPQPNGFISNVRPMRQSYGSNGSEKMDLSYTLTYVYLHGELGSGVASYDDYSDLITNLAKIIDKILNNDAISGLVDMQLGGVGQVGTIPDPAGVNFRGVIFSLNVLEYAQ